MNKGTQNPLWIVISSTVMAFPAFLPSLAEVRHFEPDGFKSGDVRFGYFMAIGWSFAVAMVASGATDPGGAFAAWLITALIVLAAYEFALRDESTVREDN